MQSGPRQSNNGEVDGRAFHRVASAFLILALVFAATEAIGLARSEQLFASEERDAVARAVASEPGNADYLARLAELEERAGADPRPLLVQAIERRPDDSDLLIRLGLAEEAAGRLSRAEELLRDATEASRKYQPRWTLANYYFRRGDDRWFWQWAREALAMSYGDRTPLFRLCWAMEPNPATISREAIPGRRDVRLGWTRFLTDQRRFAEAGEIAIELARDASHSETNALLAVTDVLLREGDYERALAVWNPLCDRALIPAEAIDPGDDNVVTNARFAWRTLSRGFDWRIPRTDGVFVTQSPGVWSVALSGSQPERREILTQHVRLVPGARYRFSSTYRSAPTGPARGTVSSGLRWRLRVPGSAVLAESDELQLAGEGTVFADFRVPEDVVGGLLILYHERPSGSMRMEGRIELREVRLEQR
jgi:tetratricopeptide (TPR) repeat protein